MLLQKEAVQKAQILKRMATFLQSEAVMTRWRSYYKLEQYKS